MNQAPTIANIFFISAAIFGLMICLFGYRIFRFLLAVMGFLVGASLSAAVVLVFTQESVLSLTKGSDFLVILIAGLVGGFILAIMLLFLYSAGVFLLGALFGIAIFSAITALTDIHSELFLYVISALVGGILTLFIQKFMIILITSLTGACMAVIGALYLINSNFDLLDPDFIYKMGDIETYRIVLSWFAVFILGVIAQFFIFPKKAGICDKYETQSEYNEEKEEN